MASVTHARVRGRPAHPAGPTFLAFTPNGKKLVTAGSNNVVRVYEHGSDGEPINIDDCQENNMAVAATDAFFVAGAEDGTVCMYSLETNEYDKMLIRSTLPIRDIALSPDGRWAAVASDELTIKVVNTEDMMEVMFIRDCPKPPKHLTFDPSGSYLTVSCTNGMVYVYSLSTNEPQLINSFDGLIQALEAESESSSKAVWHPGGRTFAVPTATRDVQIVSREGEKQKLFEGGHNGAITTLAWSPNGALLVTGGADRKLVLWDAKTHAQLAKYDYANVLNFVFHPKDNAAAFATADGEIFIYPDFIPEEHVAKLMQPLEAPLVSAPLQETSGNARKVVTSAMTKPPARERRVREDTPDSLDDILNSDMPDADADDFVVDDDGAGYALNANGKRTNMHLNGVADGSGFKRQALDLIVREPFQSGSTPWRGNRRYLCLNLTGFVWALDQETHHTVTVEFYDRDLHRNFHFTDPYRYDKACLDAKGALFSCKANPSEKTPAQVYYRPHETWTTRTDWRVELPAGEEATSLALSSGCIVVTTTANYARIYSRFGVPMRVRALTAVPAVTCAAWGSYVMTLGNGGVDASGACRLLCDIEDLKRNQMCQSEISVALSPGASGIQSAMFSDAGDPCVYDSNGVLFILQHWRRPRQASWMPLLDTRRLERLADGRKTESYWPVAVAWGRFHCITLKGGDKYPYFPRPLLTEFEFEIPIGNVLPPGDDDDDDLQRQQRESKKLEQTYVRSSLVHSLLEDAQGDEQTRGAQEQELGKLELEADKALLQLLNIECRDGDERGMKALEIASLLRDGSGRMLEAAGKIAARYKRHELEGKIAELAEARMAETEDD